MSTLSQKTIQNINEVICKQAENYIFDAIKSKHYLVALPFLKDNPYFNYICSYTLVFRKKENRIELTNLPNVNGTYPTDGLIKFEDVTNLFSPDFDINNIDSNICAEGSDEDVSIVYADQFITDETISQIKTYMNNALRSIGVVITNIDRQGVFDSTLMINASLEK